MVGLTRKVQRKDNAKTALDIPQPPNPPASYPTYVSVEARFNVDLSPPPPYTLVGALQDATLSLQPKPPGPRQPFPPIQPLPKKSSAPRSKPAVNAKKRHNLKTPDVTKPPRESGPISLIVKDNSKLFGQPPWKNAAEPVGASPLCELLSSKLDSVITSIDCEEFSGNAKELEIRDDGQSGLRGGWGTTSREVSRQADRAISSAVISTNYFSKVYLYANSRLPPNLPPLQLYFPSYPLLCLAAQYSQRAYTKPSGKEREAFVNANWRGGTKAMVIKSVPIDDMNCVVFAIRGTQTFMDWAVNVNSAPVAPTDFLDDTGNLCHSGFLSVARNMIKPVAARLRALLEEDPSRSTCSLLMTGHSAGGAVASLLYAHMLAEFTKSELNILTGCFKRIHCLTFGTPPISLLPLTKPPTLRHQKSLFMSFINEGDPVPRADKAYIRSLINLYASPSPSTTCFASKHPLKPCKPKRPTTPAPTTSTWPVPPGTLSNPGRLVVLRDHEHAGAEPTNGVKAEITSDEQLRGVVFGDPVMHVMKVYAKRVEVLATKAVTARIWG